MKIAVSRVWILDPHLLGPARVNIPNGIAIGSAAFTGLTAVRKRLSDRDAVDTGSQYRALSSRHTDGRQDGTF